MTTRLDGSPRSDKGGLRKYATLEDKQAARKEQRKAACKRWRDNNAEKLVASSKDYRTRNAKVCIERTKKWQAENADYLRGYVYKRKYGITLEDYNRMVSMREGRCDICKLKAKLVIDHCHASNKVRGLLCDRCNVALGCVKDSAEVLRSAAAYLEDGGMV